MIGSVDRASRLPRKLLAMHYSVRLADVEETRKLILPIWASNLPIDRDLDDKRRWFYRDGPHGPGQAFVLRTDGSSTEPVGCAGVGVRSMWYRDRAIRTALFADLAVDRTHRSGFPALALVRAVRAHVEHEFELGYGFPNDQARAVYLRAGYRELGTMRRYVRVLRTRTYLERRIWSPAARVAASVIDRTLAAAAWVRALRRERTIELVWLDDFDGRFDQLWREARGSMPVMCERTSALLRWRFSPRIDRRAYRIAALVETTTRRLRAYAIVRNTAGVAEVSDLLGAGMPELDLLLRCLIPTLSRLGFTSISVRFFGAGRIPNLLASHGFSRRKETRSIVVSLGASLRQVPALRDAESWYLTDLDEDV
jgi:RimJ/RimL family protein N-acetyltransferase